MKALRKWIFAMMIISGSTDLLMWYICTEVIAYQLTQSEKPFKK